MTDDKLYRIAELVCAEFKITMGDLVGRSRKHGMALPRHIAMYIMIDRRNESGSLADAARFMGRHWSDVYYAEQKIELLLATSEHTRKVVRNVRMALKGPVKEAGKLEFEFLNEER